MDVKQFQQIVAWLPHDDYQHCHFLVIVLQWQLSWEGVRCVKVVWDVKVWSVKEGEGEREREGEGW